MALLVYNLTANPVVQSVTNKTIPASLHAGARGPAVNVTSELWPDLTADPNHGKTGGRTNANFTTLQLQVTAGTFVYEWTGDREYLTPGLTTNSSQMNFVSTELTGTGAEQLTAHGLGTAPSKVVTSISALPYPPNQTITAPDTAAVTAVHAALAGNSDESVKALLDLGTLGAGHIDTIVRAKVAEEAGNDITVECIGDSAPAGGVTITEGATSVVIHYEATVSTVANIETKIGTDATLIEVDTPGVYAPALVVGDATPETHLAGGVDDVAFPGPFTNPDVPRNVVIDAQALYDGGHVDVWGTDQFGAAVTEHIAAAAGSAVAGVKIFATVTAAKRAVVGANAATVSIGTGNKLGLTLSTTNTGLLVVDGSPDSATWDNTYKAVEPSAPNVPDNSKDYLAMTYGGVTITQGAHTATNVSTTAPLNVKYFFIAYE